MTRILHTINYDEYDIFTAYEENNELPFNKDGNLTRFKAKMGDIVYLYIGEPIRKVLYKCIITDDNKNIKDAMNDEKYFKHNKKRNDKIASVSTTCCILKKLQIIDKEDVDSNKLNFESIKNVMGKEGENYSSFRGFTDKNLEYLKKTFDYIESVFDKKSDIMLPEVIEEFTNIEDELKSIPAKYKKVIVKQRIGQGKWRKYLIEQNGCKCQLCEINMEELLIASHIKEYSVCDKNTKEHLELKNGLLLCANHDKLFDRNLISFDSNGEIIISDEIRKSNYQILAINIFLKISTKLFDEKYMSYHRKSLK